MKFDLLQRKDKNVMEKMPLELESSNDLISQHFRNNCHLDIVTFSSGAEIAKTVTTSASFERVLYLYTILYLISTRSTVKTFKLSHFINLPLLICLVLVNWLHGWEHEISKSLQASRFLATKSQKACRLHGPLKQKTISSLCKKSS